MAHVCLQAGDTSLLHLLLHFGTVIQYFELMLDTIETCFPLQGNAVHL